MKLSEIFTCFPTVFIFDRGSQLLVPTASVALLWLRAAIDLFKAEGVAFAAGGRETAHHFIAKVARA